MCKAGPFARSSLEFGRLFRKDTPSMTKGMWFCVMLPFACNTAPSKAGAPTSTLKPEQPTFYCQHSAVYQGKPLAGGTRACERHPLGADYGSAFTTPIAYCYTRSMLDSAFGGWGTATMESCSPTSSECRKDHDDVGTGASGQPPVKTECHKEEIAE